MLVWITGLSGAGKTTTAIALKKALKENHQINAMHLDGDDLRDILQNTQTGYTHDERKKLAFTYARLAQNLSNQGAFVIISTISMFENIRQWNRQNNNDYFEIYLKISKKIRVARDPKNLYKHNENMADFSGQYQEPQNPDMIFDDTQNLSPDVMATMIIKNLKKQGLIK